MIQICCPQTYIPLRAEPSHRSEQVSQLIFGETATVIKEEKEWYYVKTDFDNYKGWLEHKTVIQHKRQPFEITLNKSTMLEPIHGSKLFIPIGSQVGFNDNSQMVFDNEVLKIKFTDLMSDPDLIEIIREFTGAPYLWGGRTPFGVDCSGFTQIVMKCMGIKLPRDASQQIKAGKEIPTLEKVKQGDLAFFNNDEGKIVHVGIILKNNQIVHSSGSVRIDKIDQHGIFNEFTQKYTHKLNSIRTYT